MSWAVQAISKVTAATSGNLGEEGFADMMENIDGLALKTAAELKHEVAHVPASQDKAGSLDVLMSGFASAPIGAEVDDSGHAMINIAEAPDGPAPLGDLI